MPTNQLLILSKNEDTKQELAETFITDIISQLDIIDPAEDAEQIVDMMTSALEEETHTALSILKYFLGQNLDEWLEELTVE